MNNPIIITDQLKSVTKNLLCAMAMVQTIHPVVRNYQRQILKEIKAKNKRTGEAVTNPEHTYLVEKEKLEIYYKRCDEEAAKNNLTHKPDCCPLLEAESLERQAKRVFVETVLPQIPQFRNITFDDMLLFAEDGKGNYKKDKLDRYMMKADEFIELTLNFIVPQIDPQELTFK
ncbi:MAG: hypothetical protein LBR68_00010 [Lachnoclostridium sp.]|jgi:hypothetical protein|nr:hypothetical protein [Lachnoclostridium sp.]